MGYKSSLNGIEKESQIQQLSPQIYIREEFMQQTCLECGMSVNTAERHCPKCDNALNLQHDGSTITVDIAHQGETVREALQKMQSEIDLAREGIAMRIRLVVGSGLIRDEVLLKLRDLEFRGDIIDFESEPFNTGAVVVRLK